MEVLLVEDNPSDVEAIVRLADKARLDLHMTVAGSGEEAVTQLSLRRDGLQSNGRRTPDLVLLDLSLPLTPGIDVLRWIKSDSDLCEIPVVIVSGTNDDHRIRQGQELGAHSHLAKPVTLRTLVWVVTTVRNYRSRLGRLPSAGQGA